MSEGVCTGKMTTPVARTDAIPISVIMIRASAKSVTPVSSRSSPPSPPPSPHASVPSPPHVLPVRTTEVVNAATKPA